MMKDLILKTKNILNFKVVLLFVLLLLSSFVFSTKAYALDMDIENVDELGRSDTITADIPTHGKDNINANIAFNKVDDYITYEVTIRNNTGYDYNIDSVTDNNKNKNIVLSYKHEDKITAGGTTKVEVKLEYKNKLKNVEQVTLKDLTIILNLSREDGKEEQLIINPKTLTQGSNNYLWVLILITIITGLLLIANLRWKDKHITKGLIIIALLLIPSFALAIERYQYKFTFDDIIVKGEFEVYDVTIDVDGATTTRNITYGEPIGPLPDVSKQGYNFKKWVDQNGNTVTEDTIVRKAMTVTPVFEAIKYNITYDLDDGSATNPAKYTIEDTITLTAPTKTGYVFTGWTGSNGSTPQANVTIPAGTTGDLSYTAHYSPGEDTPYKVHHKYQNINSTYTTETENLTGVTGSTVTPATKGKTGFTSPSTEQLFIKADGTSELTYTYTRNKYMLTITHPEFVEGESKEYYYEEEIVLKAKDREGYTFVKWSNNETTKQITLQILGDTTIEPIYQINEYTITFDSNGGSSVGDIHKNYNEPIGSLSTPIYNTYLFDGWFTAKNGGTQINEGTLVKEDKTYYAHWTPNMDQATITPSEVTLTAEDETDISVTGPSGMESFTYASSNDSVVTIDQNGHVTAIAAGTATISVIGARSGIEKQVPVTVNPIIYEITFNPNGGTLTNPSEATRNIEKGNQVGTLPAVTKTDNYFDGWFTESTGGTQISASTVPTGNDTYYAHWTPNINNATITPSEITLTAEDTTQISVTGPSGMESFTYASSDDSVVTVDQNGNVTAVAAGTATITITGSKSGIEKEIPVTVSGIIYTITFNPNGGSLTNPSDATREVGKGAQIGTLPNATWNTYYFEGWFTESTGGTQISTSTPATGNDTYYAHWTPNMDQAVITPSEITLTAEDTTQISVTGPNNMESYTYASTDTSIVTVDQNGNVTAVSKGTTAKITITGSKSGIVKEIPVTVNPIIYTVTFNPNGGSLTDPSEATRDIEKGDELGTLPAVTKTNNYFDGWFTASTGGTQVSASTVPTGSDTYYAHWTPNINNATITPSEITLTAEDTTQISVTGPSGMESYTYASTDTSIVTVDQNGNVTAVAKGTTAKITITGSKSGIVKEIPVTVYPIIYTITFNPKGGTLTDPDEATRDVEKGDAIGTLPSVTKANNTFDGWFTESTAGTQVTASTVPTGSTTYFAHWTETPVEILCRKATILNTEECESGTDTGKGCKRSHNAGDIITYGNIVNNDNYSAGDAFDCNVDGTGYNQRFYYLRTDNNKAVLISNNNFEGELGQKNNDNFPYSQALDQLPVKTQWNKLDVIEDNRVARLITMDDLFAVTGASSISTLTANDSLENYRFLFENSGYAHQGGRSTQWIEEISETERYRIHRNNVNVVKVEASQLNTSNNCVRPVIEIPLAAIEDAYVVRYNPVGGTIANEYVRVPRGSALSTLPTPTKEGYLFDKWYAEAEYTHAITDSTVPAGYETYYAKWVKSLATATLLHDTYTLPIDDTAQIEFVDSTDLEPVTYSSSNDSIATVTSAGVINTHAAGTATITITGTISGATKTVTVHADDGTIEYTVTFDANGGTFANPDEATREVESGSQIGTLPTVSRTDYTFDGWYTDNTFATEVLATTPVTSDMNLIAKWTLTDPVARTNGVDYATLQEAVDAVPTTAVKTTVTLLKNTKENVKVLDGRNIYLDLNGYTASNTNVSTQVFTIGVEDDATNPVSTLELVNGTVKSSQGSGMINVNINCILKVSAGAVLTATGTRQAIYTKGGTTYIYDGATLSSTSNVRATVHVLAGGSVVILGGTITSTGAYAVYNEVGTLTIGEKDGTIDATKPVIQGKTYGVVAYSTYKFYDGIIKGETAVSAKATNTGTTPNVVTDTDETKISEIEDNSHKVYGTEGNYNTLYLSFDNPKYKIDFEANGGTFSNPSDATRYVEPGDEVGTLPTITKGIYTFDGWYADSGFNTQVSATTIPTESTTYYAKWSYQASNTVVPFDITKDVMTTYYSNINTWKNDQTTFQTNMDTNFNNYSCSACNGPNDCSTPTTGDKCDQSRGYDTGVGASISVYESDEVNKTKGNLVTYTTSTDGIIYNMIPGEVYYWEANSDSNVHGLVKALGKRRIINTTVRNIRDLGGLEVDTDNDGTVDGTLKYGRMFRGTKLANSTDIANLEKLGINLEVDLRGATEGASDPKLTNYIPREITNYLINNDTYPTNYATFRQAMIDTMQDIIDDRNIYFHCRIGTDRTGTMAYFLEGLLGVAEEDRLEDYELSYFYGLTNRHRFHDYLSGSSINPRFTTMATTYDTNQKIYNWFMAGTTNQTADDALINSFRQAMINPV